MRELGWEVQISFSGGEGVRLRGSVNAREDEDAELTSDGKKVLSEDRLSLAMLSKADSKAPMLSDAGLSEAESSAPVISAAVIGEAVLSDAESNASDAKAPMLSGAGLSDADGKAPTLSEAESTAPGISVLNNAETQAPCIEAPMLSEATLTNGESQTPGVKAPLLSEAGLSEAEHNAPGVKAPLLSKATLTDGESETPDIKAPILSDAMLSDADNRAPLLSVVNAETLRQEYEDAGGRLDLKYLSVLDQDAILVKGWTHILAGYPKTGKTELVARIMAEWRNEQVLYFTEEARSAWQVRVSMLPPMRHVWFCFALGAAPEQILTRIRESAGSVVIIDTIRSLLGFEDESDNSEVSRVLVPYVAAAREGGKTLICVHHMNKYGGKHGRAITGAHAFLGAVDIGLELTQDKAGRRKLSGQGRIIEIPELIYERAEDGSFRALGSPKLLTLAEVQKRILSIIGEDLTSTKAIKEALGEPTPSDDTVLNALYSLAKRDEIVRDPPLSAGKAQGKTVRWAKTKTQQNQPAEKNDFTSDLRE